MSGKRVVVAGGSIGGLATVEALRKGGHSGPITVLAAEPGLPYDRPPLSKQILHGTWDPAKAVLRSTEALRALEVDWLEGVGADGLDLATRQVTTSDGDRLAFDDLVIATGARCRSLAGTEKLAGVHTLRTMQDAVRLRGELRPGGRAVVVGAGFIGAEFATAARAAGMDVTVVERLALPLIDKLGPVIGAVCESLLRRNGVDLRCGRLVTAVTGAGGKVREVELDDGSVLGADVVVVGIGAVPNVEWLGTEVRISDGVVCDEFCAAAPGVWAVGDVARWHNPLFGREMRIEHLTNAREQAVAVARNLLGTDERAPYAPVPYFWSDQFGAKVQFFGHADPADAVHVVSGEPDDERPFVVLFERAGRLVGAFGVDAARRLVRYRALIAASAPISEALVRPSPSAGSQATGPSDSPSVSAPSYSICPGVQQ